MTAAKTTAKNTRPETIAGALVQFQNKSPAINLDSTVRVSTSKGGYDFKYATLAHIMDAIRPVLSECNLAISQGMNGCDFYTALIHESGEEIRSTAPISMEGKMQEIGSRISYMRRYQLSALLGIVADDDDDGNADAGNHVAPRQASTPTASQPAPEADAARAKIQRICQALFDGGYQFPDAEPHQKPEDVLQAVTANPPKFKGWYTFAKISENQIKEIGNKLLTIKKNWVEMEMAGVDQTPAEDNLDMGTSEPTATDEEPCSF